MSNQFTDSSRENLSTEFMEWLRIVGDRSQTLVAEHMKPFGLSVSQGLLLGLVADWNLKGLAPLQKDLEADMWLVTSSITNLVQGLERKGLISRRDSAADGRAKELSLTEKGWKTREGLGRRALEWKQSLTSPLTEDELATAVSLLRKVARRDD